MQHAEQVSQSRKLLEFLDHRTTAMAGDVYRNPVADYVCREQAQRERLSLFRDYPLCMGLSCRLPNPGDFLTDDYSGMPILLVRDADGRLHALVNACPHRGARVAEGQGDGARVFTCPYHAWSYGLDGALRSRPEEASFEGFPREDCSLMRLPVVERHGMIWVLPNPDGTMDLDAHLAGLDADLAAYDLGGYHHYETREMRRQMNWKLIIDTFLETYHISALHNESLWPLLHSNLTTFDAFGRNLRMIAARRSIEEMRAQPEAEWDLVRHSAIVNILFPNTVFIMQGDHLETWHVFPDGNDPDRAVMYISLYTPEPATTDSARRHWDRNFNLLMAVVRDEDFPLGEGIQAGFLAGARQEIVFGRNEPALQHYHRSIRDALTAAA
jgi:phenylpropionate dioxygenase-like ring-hydroxylating dioxygenase large terminal subunit